MMRLQTELFTPQEVFAADPRLRGLLPATLDCAVCSQDLEQRASYFAIVVNHSTGMWTVAAVCTACGQDYSRQKLQKLVEGAVRLMFDPEMGHA
jgi:hypothetical protein